MSITGIDAPDYSGAPATGAAVLQTRITANIPAGQTQVFGPYFTGTGDQVATIINTTNQVAYTQIAYTWCSGPSLGSAIGINSFAYMGSSQTFDDLRAVLGPYLFIQITNNTGAGQGMQIVVNLIATGATRGQVFGYQVLQNWNGAIAAATTSNFVLSINCPGRAKLQSLLTAVGASIRLITTANPNLVVIFDHISTVANESVDSDIILPNNDVLVQLGSAGSPASTYVGSLAMID